MNNSRQEQLTLRDRRRNQKQKILYLVQMALLLAAVT